MDDDAGAARREPEEPPEEQLKPTATVARKDPRPFRFQDLPSEVRNEIYEYVVRSAWGSPKGTYYVVNQRIPSPSIFRLDRQTRAEALDIFLRRNHFHIYSVSGGGRWLRSLGKETSRLRTISVFLDRPDLVLWQDFIRKLVDEASVLRELIIRKADVTLEDIDVERLLDDLGYLEKRKWGDVNTVYGWVVVEPKNNRPRRPSLGL